MRLSIAASPLTAPLFGIAASGVVCRARLGGLSHSPLRAGFNTSGSPVVRVRPLDPGATPKVAEHQEPNTKQAVSCRFRDHEVD